MSPWIRWFWCSLATVEPEKREGCILLQLEANLSTQVQQIIHAMACFDAFITSSPMSFAILESFFTLPSAMPWSTASLAVLPSSCCIISRCCSWSARYRVGQATPIWDMKWEFRSTTHQCLSCLFAFQQSSSLSFVTVTGELYIQIRVSIYSTSIQRSKALCPKLQGTFKTWTRVS